MHQERIRAHFYIHDKHLREQMQKKHKKQTNQQKFFLQTVKSTDKFTKPYHNSNWNTKQKNKNTF